MSQTYIPGIVESIRSDSTPYSPIIEAITNAIDAINKAEQGDGKIDIYLERENPLPGTQGNDLPSIVAVRVKDNGVGFTDENRKSFDTVYSPQKKDIGGKGFGRFFYLRHFQSANIESVYLSETGLQNRTFDFGKEYDVVVNEVISDIDEAPTGTILTLKDLQKGNFEKDAEIVAHRILEQLLSYIIKKAKRASLSDLAQYVAFRKAILDLLRSTIKLTEDGTYKSEKELHDIIFPTKTIAQ